MGETLVPVQIGGDGLVGGVRYHDGRILAIAFFDDSRIEITIASADGDERTSFVLESVVRFVANSVMEGNIVSDIYVWRREHAPREVVANLYAMGINLDSLESARIGFVLSLYCSYGAEIYAVLGAIPKCRVRHGPSLL